MDEYFSVCTDQSVLEIGPYLGLHTEIILANKPKQLDLVDANPSNQEPLERILGVDNVIIDDVLFYLQNPKPYDVVVCCGVLYHLHCPLYLLELIANNANPEWVILDCRQDLPKLSFIVEPDNVTKNRFTKDGWKSTKFSIVAPFEIVNLAMQNMNYQLIKHTHVNVWDYKPKVDTWVGLWRKT
jgi:2-polyprenyl-3-methyl-5-hydroxy-6-metoxy-1,4-benzoquinol methylase